MDRPKPKRVWIDKDVIDGPRCTIDESIKGDASQSRCGITFDGNIDVMYIGWTIVTYVHHWHIIWKIQIG